MTLTWYTATQNNWTAGFRNGSMNEPAAAGVRCAERGGAGGKDRANELIEKAMTGPASRPED
jgi:hypothetical protein